MVRLLSGRLPSLFARSFSSASASAATTSTIADDGKYILGLYARYPVEFVRGQGSRLFDSSNRRYLDLSSGIAVNSLGHSDKDWQTTLATQAAQLTHVSNLFYSQPAVSLAKKLVESSGFDKVFFCNSGTEANEAAFKFARKYAYDKHIKAGGKEGENKKFKVIAFNGGFHGRSMGSLSLTYKNAYKLPFLPLIEGVSFLPFNDIQAIKQAMNDSVCAVIVEPIQGEAGVFPASAEFLQEIRKLCNDHDALMICDEVQCGLGRLGVMWAHQAFAVTPDVVTLAKPLGNGLPIGAVLVKQKVADSLKPGDHGSTFAGNPLVTAVAGTVFDKLSAPQFLSDVRTNSKLLISKLKELQAKLNKENKDDEVKITAVRAHNDQGFLIGVDLNIPQKNVIKKGLSDHAVVLISGGDNTLRIAPPLTISADEIMEAVGILEKLFLGVKKSSYSDAK